VVLAGLEEHPITGTDDLDRGTAPVNQSRGPTPVSTAVLLVMCMSFSCSSIAARSAFTQSRHPGLAFSECYAHDTAVEAVPR
jgi:hypothetical protein